MRRDPSTTPDDLQRPEGNGLKANYDKHDVGEAEFIERCEDLGFVVEEWGIDMRGDDGAGGVIYDDAMDFKVYAECDEDSADAWVDVDHIVEEPEHTRHMTPLRLVALVDVKTKSGPRYMGRFNKRHFENYADHAHEFGVPTFVVMFQVEYRENAVHDEFVFRIEPYVGDGDAASESERVLSSAEDYAVDPFPDGNHAVLVTHRYRDDWEYFVGQTTFERALGGP